MSIIRKAILISSPLSTGTDLGTDKDIELWQNFLKSPNGGCWDPDDEIQPFISPTSDEVIGYIQKLKINNPELKYVFFAFSGHGQNRDGEDIVYPFKNLDDFLPVSEIEKEIKKLDISATVIIDACRLSSFSLTAQNNQQGTNPPPKCGIIFRPLRDGTSTTIAFKWNLHNTSVANKKVLLIQSCSANEEARMAVYSDITCSLFTSELIKVGLAASNSMSIQEAFSKAANSTEGITRTWNANNVQHPYISDDTIKHLFCLGKNEVDEAEKYEQGLCNIMDAKH